MLADLPGIALITFSIIKIRKVKLSDRSFS